MLSPSRHAQLLRCVTVQQRKVFDCIPISEAWSFKQINAEITRRGMAMRWDQFQGCVDALKQAGVVKEISTGMFMREPVRNPDAPIIVLTEDRPMPQEIKTKPNPATPIDALAALAQRVRTISDVAIQLHHEAVKLADEIEHVALDFEERGEQNSKAAEQLAQLRALLGVSQ
jgi:hypothetical protein